MRFCTAILASALSLSAFVMADTGGCTDFAIQTTWRACNAGDELTAYSTDEAVCSDTNWAEFLKGAWSDEPNIGKKLLGQDYTRPDSFQGTFKCDNSNPTLDFQRNGGGYDVYCSGGDGSVKTYAGDRDETFDGYTFPCQNTYWHWAYISGFNPCWC